MENIITLLLLILLQAVLGFDNLLYISLESKRAPTDEQKRVRFWGIVIAIVFRIGLLFILLKMISYFNNPLFTIDFDDIISGSFNVHSIIVLLGGAFIIYTAVKEIIHIVSLEKDEHENAKPKSTSMIIVSIVIMNIVFSFDSILSAMALTDVFWVMAVAIIAGGVLMIWLSGAVSEFLKKNRLYEVLGLFILFIVGIMLITEGGHLARLHIFGTEITQMNKATFYFVIFILVLTDLVQGRYQKKLMRKK